MDSAGIYREKGEETRDKVSNLLRFGYRPDHLRTTSQPFAKNQFQTREGGKREMSRDISHSRSCANIKLCDVHLVRIGYENWSVFPRPASVWSELTSLRRNWNCIFNDQKRKSEELNGAVLHRGGCWRWTLAELFAHREMACCLICRETLFVGTKRHPLKDVVSTRVLSLRILCKSCWHGREIVDNLNCR